MKVDAGVKGSKDKTVKDWEGYDKIPPSPSPLVQPWAMLQDFNINKLQTAGVLVRKKAIWFHETTYFNKHGIHASSNVLHF